MQEADFEWDDDKAAQNFVRHGVSFERARLAFADPCGVGEVDDARTLARSVSPWSAWSRAP